MSKNRRKQVEENASPSYWATKRFTYSQVHKNAQIVDFTGLHKHKILGKLNTSPSWMWLSWWRGRLQSASASKGLSLFYVCPRYSAVIPCCCLRPSSSIWFCPTQCSPLSLLRLPPCFVSLPSVLPQCLLVPPVGMFLIFVP